MPVYFSLIETDDTETREHFFSDYYAVHMRSDFT